MTASELRSRSAALMAEITMLQNAGDADPARISALIDEAEALSPKIENAERLERLERPIRKTRPEGERLTNTYTAGAHLGTMTSILQAVPGAALDSLGRFVRSGQITNAMSETLADGGYAVTPELDREILKMYANQSGLLNACKCVNRGSNDTYTQPVAVGLPAVGWSSEGGVRAATNSPTFVTVTPTRGELYANTSASSWIEQDFSYGELGTWLLGEIARAEGQELGKQLILGDGTDKPTGLSTVPTAATADGARAFGTAEHVLSGTSAKVTVDACISTFFKLQPEFQANASWIMHPATFGALRSERAALNGSYLIDVSVTQGMGSGNSAGTLLGRPIYLDVNVAVQAANALSVIVGDFSRGYSCVYYGRDTFLRDPYSVKGQISFYSARRVGGKFMDTNAFKFVKCSP